MIAKILFKIAEAILTIIAKRMDADNRKKLFELDEIRRESKAVEYGEQYIRENDNLFDFIDKLFLLSGLGKKQKAILKKKYRKITQQLEKIENLFFKFNN